MRSFSFTVEYSFFYAYYFFNKHICAAQSR